MRRKGEHKLYIDHIAPVVPGPDAIATMSRVITGRTINSCHLPLMTTIILGTPGTSGETQEVDL